jgi:hypothetical protein
MKPPTLKPSITKKSSRPRGPTNGLSGSDASRETLWCQLEIEVHQRFVDFELGVGDRKSGDALGSDRETSRVSEFLLRRCARSQAASGGRDQDQGLDSSHVTPPVDAFASERAGLSS